MRIFDLMSISDAEFLHRGMQHVINSIQVHILMRTRQAGIWEIESVINYGNRVPSYQAGGSKFRNDYENQPTIITLFINLDSSHCSATFFARPSTSVGTNCTCLV
jgi:hypothetical protein